MGKEEEKPDQHIRKALSAKQEDDDYSLRTFE
jgi:hypothetical protein